MWIYYTFFFLVVLVYYKTQFSAPRNKYLWLTLMKSEEDRICMGKESVRVARRLDGREVAEHWKQLYRALL